MKPARAYRSLCLALGLALATLPPMTRAQDLDPVPGRLGTPPAITAAPTLLAQTRDAPPNQSYDDVGGGNYGGGDGGDYGGDDRRPAGGSRNWLIPAIVVGAAALFAIGKTLAQEKTETRDESAGTRELLRDGPQLAPQFNASAFGVRGLVRGGWPVVVDYAQQRPGRVLLRIAIPGAETVSYRLDQFGLGRHVLRFELPPFLGDSLRPAVIALTAADLETGQQTIDGFNVHGLGIGPRAVGSVAVDRLEFDPGLMRPARGDTARYAFHSRSDFDHAAVEFMQVSQSPDGVRKRYVKGERIGPVQRDSRVESLPAQRWDGRDERAQPSAGRHQLQVRVWDEGGDWVGAWSESVVLVQ
ncbi:MAG TPA: hypothetical protein PLF79_11090 [Thauera sp.]|nr:hypothetical protein [Thauera sp.]